MSQYFGYELGNNSVTSHFVDENLHAIAQISEIASIEISKVELSNFKPTLSIIAKQSISMKNT
jgi:hypothetical protein